MTLVSTIRACVKESEARPAKVAAKVREDAGEGADTAKLKAVLDAGFKAYLKAEGAAKIADIPGAANLKSRAKELLGIPKASQGRKAKSDLGRILEMLAKADLDVAGIGAVADALTAKAVALRTAQEAASVVASIAA